MKMMANLSVAARTSNLPLGLDYKKRQLATAAETGLALAITVVPSTASTQLTGAPKRFLFNIASTTAPESALDRPVFTQSASFAPILPSA